MCEVEGCDFVCSEWTRKPMLHEQFEQSLKGEGESTQTGGKRIVGGENDIA